MTLTSLKCDYHYPGNANLHMPLNRLKRHFLKILLNCTSALILIGLLPTSKVYPWEQQCDTWKFFRVIPETEAKEKSSFCVVKDGRHP